MDSRPRIVAGIAIVMLASSCADDIIAPEAYNSDWTPPTHGVSAPQYDEVFPQSRVNTIEIVLTDSKWKSVRENMKSILGTDFGKGGPMGGPIGGPAPIPGPGGPGGPGGAGPGEDLELKDPSYVDVTLRYNGKQWKNVGFRLKGNSSLAGAWSQGIYKLPFRLKLDEFENRYPGTRDQRFFGFQELSFSPGTGDASLIREKLAADLLRLGGIPAARTAFYRVIIDFGNGLEYCGVYTAVEVIDDTMIRDQFAEDQGNLYKPTSRLATFVRTQFEKKSNVTAGDYRDVQALITALNSPARRTNPPQWRAGLEATFDVSHFLKWLAANTAMVNWDVYGAIAHNYYLYHHSTRKLVWIPWDHDLSLDGQPGITGTSMPPPGPIPIGPGGPPPGGIPDSLRVGPSGMSLSMNEVGAEWPLLRFLADDPVYAAQYKANLKAFAASVLVPARIEPIIDRYHALIAPHVVGPTGERPGFTHLRGAAAFTSSPDRLKGHIRARATLVSSFAP